MKGNLIDFEIEQKVFFFSLGYIKLSLGYPSKFIFLQYFNCAIKGNLSDFEIEHFFLILGYFKLLLGSTEYPLIIKTTYRVY